MAPRTINIYLADGTLESVRYLRDMRHCTQLYIVPRERIQYLIQEKKLNQHALYFLLGENEKGEAQAYIGQTSDAQTRIRQHKNKKDFWTKALVFVSENDSFTGDTVRYLEDHAFHKAKEMGRYDMTENSIAPNDKSNPHETIKALWDTWFENLQLLCSLAGCHIFEPKPIAPEPSNPKPKPAPQPPTPPKGPTAIEPTPTDEANLFFTEKRGANAKGIYNPSTGEFTVLAGSILVPNQTPSFRTKDRAKKLKKWTVPSPEGKLRLIQNQVFGSPSGAGGFCTGRTHNGWKIWKDASGRSLGKIYPRPDKG